MTVSGNTVSAYVPPVVSDINIPAPIST